MCRRQINTTEFEFLQQTYRVRKDTRQKVFWRYQFLCSMYMNIQDHNIIHLNIAKRWFYNIKVYFVYDYDITFAINTGKARQLFFI